MKRSLDSVTSGNEPKLAQNVQFEGAYAPHIARATDGPALRARLIAEGDLSPAKPRPLVTPFRNLRGLQVFRLRGDQ